MVAKISTLIDKWAYASLNTTKWDFIGDISIAKKQIKLTAGQGISSKLFYDFTGSQAFTHVIQDGPVTNFIFTFFTPSGDGLSMGLSQGDTLWMAFTSHGEVDRVSIPFDSKEHANWRMRERFGDAIWETSSDGTNWKILRQATHGADLRSGKLLIMNMSGAFGEGLFGNEEFGGAGNVIS
jgi:hypothetical protein